MDDHETFTNWATGRGVIINGIAAHRFAGRGIGIIAKKNLEAGEQLVSVPTSALRTSSTVAKRIRNALPKITVHGLLAADMSLDNSPTLAPWRAVLPTPQDFSETVPLLWHSSLQSLLPDAAKKLLTNQKIKLAKDWAAVSKAFPEIPYDDYVYHWLTVNTRTFFYTSGNTAKALNRDDCMALSPFADYFNHAESGCEVLFTDKGYIITADRFYKTGEEVYISYGNHSNDFLLAEYGFILESNRWDEIPLDAFIFPILSETQKGDLEAAGFLGNYLLDKGTVCHRTQVALRITCLPFRKWERFVDGRDDGEKDQDIVNRQLHDVIERHLREVSQKLQDLSDVKVGLSSQRETLTKRWRQIKLLLRAVAK